MFANDYETQASVPYLRFIRKHGRAISTSFSKYLGQNKEEEVLIARVIFLKFSFLLLYIPSLFAYVPLDVTP